MSCYFAAAAAAAAVTAQASAIAAPEVEMLLLAEIWTLMKKKKSDFTGAERLGMGWVVAITAVRHDFLPCAPTRKARAKCRNALF